MSKDFVLNATLLITAFSLMGQFFKNKPLKPGSPISTKLYWGLSFGILGNILMLFSMKINTHTIADLRHLAIVIPAAFGGFFPAFIASILIAVGRLTLFGFDIDAILPAAAIPPIGIVCGAIAKLQYSISVKAFLMNIAALMILSVVFLFQIDDIHLLRNLLLVHYSISLIGGFLAFHFAFYIDNSNEAHRQLKLNLAKLKESEEKLQKANDKLNRLTYLDGLTGIANRRYFDETMEKEWAKDEELALVMFDLDYFKNYNDTYGHLQGDYCLQLVSGAISNLFQNTNYFLCRYGGEEFALILPSSGLEDGMGAAREIQQEIQNLRIPHISSVVADIITLSIGVASMVPKKSLIPEELIKKADSALYLSKANGRNTITSE